MWALVVEWGFTPGAVLMVLSLHLHLARVGDRVGRLERVARDETVSGYHRRAA